MRTEDLKLIKQLGHALYAAPEVAQTRSLETVAALSTLPFTSDEQELEKVIYLLLLQAEKEGLKATSPAVSNPYFRLSPVERVVLGFLHSGQLGYKKLAQIFKKDPLEIQTIAWQARLKIAGSAEVELRFREPHSPSLSSSSCPEYFGEHPWSQKLLDDEMNSSELIFIQNHAQVCQGCAQVLKQTRELYYAVERCIPHNVLRREIAQWGGIPQKTLDPDVQALERVFLKNRAPRTLCGSFFRAAQAFFSKKSTWGLLALIFFVLFLSVR